MVARAPAGWHVWVDTLTGIAQIVIALALIGIGLLFIAILLLLRKLYGSISGAVEKVRLDIAPALANATAVTESAKTIAATAQSKVEELSATVSTANGRVTHMVEVAERRVADLGALLDVAQQEAEELFFRTASAVRGVHAGAAAFRDSRGERPGAELQDGEDVEVEIRVARGDAGHTAR
ncbi:MAG TPA: hypothetical protein VF625_04795, partial [Longimicrobium sp.]|jgi:uncharacterized protein YoxC